MLSAVRDLNFGATFGQGRLDQCTQETIFKENMAIAERRFLFDALRTGQANAQPQQFIMEAHRRVKK